MKRVLVAGLGAAGSATLYHLARAGVRAVGIDPWLVGPLPGVDGVTVVKACSGHGFKASSAIGEGAAALAMGVAPPVPLAPFALDGPS